MEVSGLKRSDMKKSLSCPMCRKLFRQVTTIEVCRHQFCHDCIRKRITEEGLNSCPVCNADLGPTPLQTLRLDHRWQSIMDNFNEEERQEIEGSGQSKERTKFTRVFSSSNQSTTTSCNEKQKYAAAKAEDDGISSILQQSRELLARHRVEEVPAVFAPRTRKINQTQVVGDDNTKRNQRHDTFWFCLVASDNQKSKPPLEHIPSRYLRLKDGNITVSYIKKYLVQKLNLCSEDEVEISLEGRKLLPSLQLRNLMDLWLQTKATTGCKSVAVGSSAEDFVMVLKYSQKPCFSV